MVCTRSAKQSGPICDGGKLSRTTEFQIVEKGKSHWIQRTEVSRFRRRSEPSDVSRKNRKVTPFTQSEGRYFEFSPASDDCRATSGRFVSASLPGRMWDTSPQVSGEVLQMILVDFQRLNLRFQRGPRYPQLGCSARGSFQARLRRVSV
jgi:hypothetical protein